MATIKISVSSLERALAVDFPPANEYMIIEWCKKGLIDYWMNANGRRYYLKPTSLSTFLREQLNLKPDALKRVSQSLGVQLI